MQAVSDVKAHYIILFNPRGNLTTVCLSKIGVSLIAKLALGMGQCFMCTAKISDDQWNGSRSPDMCLWLLPIGGFG